MAHPRDNGAGREDDANAVRADAATRAWILTDGKPGDEIPCLGLAGSMGLAAERRIVRPRALFAACAPYGPIDPAERPACAASPLRPPFPDILIASGRRCVPYLRFMRRAARGRTFTIFLKNPRVPLGVADLVWAPLHDGLAGPNLIATLTAPHTLTPAALAAARRAPDPRLAALPAPRVALLVGGDSNSHRFRAADVRALVDAVGALRAAGASVMITPSRRTPAAARAALSALAAAKTQPPVFYWDGAGQNPYRAMVALADAILVTADSTNMVGEATASAAPVMVLEPSGGGPRSRAFLHALQESGAIRPWRGTLETWPRDPLDSTPQIAAAALRRYCAWRAARPAHADDPLP